MQVADRFDFDIFKERSSFVVSERSLIPKLPIERSDMFRIPSVLQLMIIYWNSWYAFSHTKPDLKSESFESMLVNQFQFQTS